MAKPSDDLGIVEEMRVQNLERDWRAIELAVSCFHHPAHPASAKYGLYGIPISDQLTDFKRV